MNTPAHLIFGAAAFGDATRPRATWAALAGGLVPDLSLYLMAGVSLYVIDIPARVVFGQLYFSQAWQGVFAVDNSFVLWGVLAYVAWRLERPALRAFAGAGLLHLVFDFLLHHDDARRQFWPLSDWVFASPVSYWDNARFGGVVGPLEIAASAVLTAVLLVRFRPWSARAGFAALFGMEILASGIWRFVF